MLPPRIRLLARPPLVLLASVLGLLAAPASAGGHCETLGACHLSPWFPPLAGTADRVGWAVALDGRNAAVGAWGDDAVHLYRRREGSWVHTQRLDGPPGSNFGWSLDLDGDRLIVGAPGADGGIGRAFVHALVNGRWTLEQELDPITAVPGGGAGTDVALSGPHAAVGVPGAGLGGVDVYRFDGVELGPLAPLTGLGSQDFGRALDLDGDLLAVGDPLDDDRGGNAGAVYLFRLDPGGAGLFQKTAPAAVGATDLFGSSVALEGDRLVVGAPGDDTLGTNAGAAYVMARTTLPVAPFETFEELDQLLPCGATGGEAFGRSVDLAEGRIAVGAPGSGAPGRVQVFRRRVVFGESWPHEVTLEVGSFAGDEEHGRAVAVHGDLVLGGAPGHDGNGNQSGTAVLWSLASDSLEGACPCDGLAGVASVGGAIPGLLGEGVLSLVDPPVLGQSTLVRLENLPAGSQPFLWLAPDLPGLRLDPLRPLAPGGGYVAFPQVTALEQVGLGWNVPADPVLCGSTWHLFAFWLDPGAPGPHGIALSNRLRAVLGY